MWFLKLGSVMTAQWICSDTNSFKQRLHTHFHVTSRLSPRLPSDHCFVFNMYSKTYKQFALTSACGIILVALLHHRHQSRLKDCL